jgi:hypothetical protein
MKLQKSTYFLKEFPILLILQLPFAKLYPKSLMERLAFIIFGDKKKNLSKEQTRLSGMEEMNGV